jgi:hypothetical protein
MSSALRVLLLAVIALLATAASAHELSMAEMELRETSPRRIFVAMDCERPPSCEPGTEASVAEWLRCRAQQVALW